MKPKDDLFRLIKSLSRSEKRYFTLDAKKSGAKSSQYLKLFQAINAMNEYDESRFPKDLSNVSVGKAYLYEAILRSMRDYRSPKSKRAQLKQRIMDAKFLYERGLYAQCAERLNSARRIAMELADNLALLEINREERRLVKERGMTVFGQTFTRFKNESNVELDAILKEFVFLDRYDHLSLEVNSHFRYSESDKIDALKKDIKPESWIEPENIEAKLGYLKAKALFYHLTNEPQIANEYFQKSAELWDENPVLKREEYFRYIKDLANAISFSFFSGKMKLIGELLKKLEDEPAGNFHEENLKFRTLISHRINFLTESKQFYKSETLESEVETGLTIFDIGDSRKLTIWIQTASMMLASGKPERSHFWLNKIINFKDLTVRRDIQRGARVLNVLLVSELEDYDTVELLIRAYTRFFKKNYGDAEAEFELKFLHLMKNLIPFPLNKKEKKSILDFYMNSKDSTVRNQLFRGWLIYSKILKSE